MTSLLSHDRLNIIRRRAESVINLPGCTAEVGVYRGGVSKIIAEILPNKQLHLFDTFTGIPMKGEHDVHNIGDFKDTTLEQVKEYLSNHKNISYHVGWFPRDTGKNVENEQFCFVHLDADQYQSTKEALEFFYPRMVKGGVIVFDDYEWENCPGVKKAIDEFLADKLERVVVEARHQCTLVKQ